MEEMKNLVNVEETMVNESVEIVEEVSTKTNLQKSLAVAGGIAIVGLCIYTTKKVIEGTKALDVFRRKKNDDIIEDDEFEEVDETDEEVSDEE